MFCDHPAVKMWRGYEGALEVYYNLMCQEYSRRIGNYATMHYNPNNVTQDHIAREEKPWWMNDRHVYDKMIWCHRGNLYQKDPNHYHAFRMAGDYYDLKNNGLYWPKELEVQRD